MLYDEETIIQITPKDNRMKIISRQEAIAQGMTQYFTGIPCKRNHLGVRTVSTCCCVECTRVARSEYYTNNKEKALLAIKNWQLKNKEKVNKNSRAWRANNPDSAEQVLRRYYETHKEKKLRGNKLWRQMNKDVVQQYNVKRRVQLGVAMPVWANIDAIAAFYRESTRLSKETGIMHHVDHIIPLENDLVCGLHVEHNLQILTQVENNFKRNKFEIE